MVTWMGMHPWMTFFIAMAAVGAIREILSPAPVVSVTPTPAPGTAVGAWRLPATNGVYGGLVRRYG